MYHLVISKSAEKDLLEIPKSHYTNVVSRIQALKTNPRPSGCKKLTGSINEYRIRVGEYRILYTVSDEMIKVFVIRIRHRKDVYE